MTARSTLWNSRHWEFQGTPTKSSIRRVQGSGSLTKPSYGTSNNVVGGSTARQCAMMRKYSA
jgi:hypothetical protein